ncbi:hypothetical protein ACFL2V_21925 [Pseudomonadota bacterium]
MRAITSLVDQVRERRVIRFLGRVNSRLPEEQASTLAEKVESEAIFSARRLIEVLEAELEDFRSFNPMKNDVGYTGSEVECYTNGLRKRQDRINIIRKYL